jgi:hypothetical protein
MGTVMVAASFSTPKLELDTVFGEGPQGHRPADRSSAVDSSKLN